MEYYMLWFEIVQFSFWAGLVALFIYYHWSRRHFYKFSRESAGPRPLPILGDAVYFLGDTENILNGLLQIGTKFKKPGKTITAWLGHQLAIVAVTPEEMEILLNSSNSIQKSDVYKFLKPVCGDSIFSTKDLNKWKMHRKYITSTMNQKILTSYVKHFHKLTLTFCDRIEKFSGGGDFDVFPFAYDLTIDMLAETTLGVKINQQKKPSQLAYWLDEAMMIAYSRIFKPWLHLDAIFYRTKNGEKFNYYKNNILEFGHKIVADKREEYKNRKHDFDDGTRLISTLDLLVEISEKEGKMSDQEIVSELITLIIGGSDSSAIIDSFALMMLGMHQDIQDKVYDELREVFGDSDRPVTVEDLPHLKLLERVIKETMRLFPIGPVIARMATEDIDMKSCVIPKGSLLALVILRLHRHEDVWVDPFKFDPDRFLPERFSKMHPYSFLPFSGGPRNCIGLKFASLSMKTVLATILRKYKVFCDVGKIEDIRLKADVMLRAVDGNIIRIAKRAQ